MPNSLKIALVIAVLTACGRDATLHGKLEGSYASAGSGGGSSGGATSASGGATSASGGSGGGGGVHSVHDPALVGPFTIAELDATTKVAATGHTVAIHCAYPTAGPDAGPYPVIVFGHGFQLSAKQYEGYVRHLATFGYVALTVDFPAGLLGNKHTDNAKDLIGGIDWAASHATVAPLANVGNAGASGHSLGAKVALLAATIDVRIGASITIDPVDSSMGCSPQDCPDVSDKMPIAIPTGFIGETLDATGGFQACAPAADNFDTFFAKTSSPSIRIEVLGASHMSFIGDPASCGAPCLFCKTATAAHDQIVRLSRAMLVAFYERHLKGRSGYDAHLFGAKAQERYVATGLAKITHK